MNSENVAFLQDNMKYLGFGEKLQLNKQLEEQIEKNPKDFQLKAQATFDESSKLDAVLHFRRSDQSGLYFFNKYDAHLKNENDPSADRSQTFYINKGSGVTLKEAFNLLQGRAVNKDLTNAEGQKYNAWLQLNFNDKDEYGNFKIKRYTENYGFNLEKQLGKLPVREADNNHPKYNDVIKSLKKGNLVEVSSPENEKRYITANPPKGRVELYDGNKILVEVKREQKQRENQSNGQKNDLSNKNTMDDGVQSDQGKKNTKKEVNKTHSGDDLEEVAHVRKRGRGR